MERLLIIQTAFLGDVILATPLIEKWRQFYPEAAIDFLVRKGNEGLLEGHPHLRNLIVWDKKNKKYNDLLRVAREVRRNKYDVIVNLQRFASSGFIVANSGAALKIGFDKNPFSFSYTRKIPHIIGNGLHEVDRNLACIADYTDNERVAPRLYPLDEHYSAVALYQAEPYVCIAPTSVWFTKQFPLQKWAEFIDALPPGIQVYLLGASGDTAECESLAMRCSNPRVANLSGKLKPLESAALMKGARMNYVNDSAPMHMASAMNAPVTAVFCSTIPDFGFGPLSTVQAIVETTENLSCRPCGIHGHKACPKGHFKCAEIIQKEQLLNTLPDSN